MKSVLEAIIIAFSMYSKIPMPQIQWNDKNLRYSLIFFPCVGAAVSLSMFGLCMLFWGRYLSPVFFAGIAVFIPLLLTGGIHMDGFCDTCDALSSNKSRDEKLCILKDPHTGAFAIIYTVALLLIQFGAWSQIYVTPALLGMVLTSFILSRSLAAWAIISIPHARSGGLAAIFADASAKKVVRMILLFYIVACAAMVLYIHLVAGAVMLAAIMLFYVLFRMLSKRQFGGITGDLAGFMLMVSETIALVVAAFAGGMIQ